MKLLIPLSFLNESTNLSSNIDEKQFKMHLKLAQEDLQDILGYEFYTQIETQYDPNNDTFSTANATLYENYIKDYLAWRTMFLYTGFSQSSSTPTGFRAFDDENSSVLGAIEMAALGKNIEARANNYKYRMIKYMRLQQQILSTNFPLWVDSCKAELSFAITAIRRDTVADKAISIDKTITSNE